MFLSFFGYIVGFVIVMALLIVVVAIVFVTKNKRKFDAMPIITKRATIKKTYTKIQQYNSNFNASGTVDSASAYEKTIYYVEFKLDNGEKKTFQVKKKEFKTYNIGDKGKLSFKANKLIGFELNQNNNLDAMFEEDALFFFEKKNKGLPLVKFYGEAPSFNVNIFSDKAIDCDYDEVCNFIDRMNENETDNFFVLERSDHEYVEAFNNGKDDKFEVDVPIDGAERYVIQIETMEELKELLKVFFNGENILNHYPYRKES